MARPFAQIAVLAQMGRAGGLFTYRVPDELQRDVRLGSLVRVPFTNRQFQGVVCSLDETCELPRVRDIAELLDGVPVATDHQLRLAVWIADYYAASIADVLGAMLPPGLDRRTVYLLQPGIEPNGHRITDSQQRILEAVRRLERVPIQALKRELGEESGLERDVVSLLKRGLLVRVAELAPPRVRERTVTLVTATAEGVAALHDRSSMGRSVRRREVMEFVVERGPVSTADIAQFVPNASAAIKYLVERGLLSLRQSEVARASPLDRRSIAVTSPLRLSPAQAAAYSTITASIRARNAAIYLLHGVTGSGKTEVYLQAIADTIEGGRSAIMMVPEISLTPQAVERVAGRFPGRVAVLHSKLSDAERVDEWQRIRRGEADIVVGPRSALFAPVQDPGLIIVDEEHDPSYKQDSSPRYNARDAAAVLGRNSGATVVFGSATPDIVTYHAARSGRIKLLELPDRPVWGSRKDTDGSTTPPRAMPTVEIVDMRQELKSGNRGMFSSALMDGLTRTLLDGHQALLFLNRRGSATVVLCRDCGFVLHCPSCDIPFTYHSAATRLICHRCDRRTTSPRACPACASPRIRYLGAGTQRVEEETVRLFPHARVLRWDRDVTGGKDAHEDLLRQFARHEADILVGTQMIAKGLDFPLVTLVGVVSADTGLHMPDFRAPERSFQLLTQVAGRAGRSSLPSRVVVQTYTPEHYAIQASQQHDYHRFYAEEMTFRESARYPPHARLIRFVYSSEDAEQCRRSAANLRSILERAMVEEDLPEAEIIGPAPCFVARFKNRYYWQVIVRGPARSGGKRFHRLLDHVPPGWVIDVDPVDLL